MERIFYPMLVAKSFDIILKSKLKYFCHFLILIFMDKMDETTRQQCITVTKELINHPLASYLAEKTSTIKEDLLRFEDEITIGGILVKLNENKYSSINEWKDEMNRFWEECLHEYQKGSQCYAAVCVLSDKFQNKLGTMKFTPEERWIQKVKANVKILLQLISSANS